MPAKENRITLNRLFIIVASVLVAIGIGLAWWWVNRLASAPQKEAEDELFVVSRTATTAEVERKLRERGLYKSEWAFERILSTYGGYAALEAGGYTVSKAMDAKILAKTLAGEPSHVWVTIPEGLRKEQIAIRLAEALEWSTEEEENFVNVATAMTFEKKEGYYFPDTYLFARNEKSLDVANKMLARFEEAFFPYFEKFLQANIRHDTAVRLASIIEREAAGASDMRLIAGILWNRLQQGMRLEIDATVQYVVGSKERGWWPKITREDIALASPYNTYQVQGLPPDPISNPGLAAIDAVLNAEETDCLFYLHDANRMIHCSPTFEGHQQNIEAYLRSNK